jgi:hypothetical protein
MGLTCIDERYVFIAGFKKNSFANPKHESEGGHRYKNVSIPYCLIRLPRVLSGGTQIENPRYRRQAMAKTKVLREGGTKNRRAAPTGKRPQPGWTDNTKKFLTGAIAS